MPTMSPPKMPLGEKVFAAICLILGGLTMLWVILSIAEIGLNNTSQPVYHAWNFFILTMP